jgi:squalene synthase HpnC
LGPASILASHPTDRLKSVNRVFYLQPTGVGPDNQAVNSSASNAPDPSEHYENFPVASLLCPPRIRPAVSALYWFARTADDLADEGDASAEERLADLAQFRADLLCVARGGQQSGRWPQVFHPLHAALERVALPVPLLQDLLDAFVQDVIKTRDRLGYADQAELMDYCRRSANPVGRLLLHLYGVNDAASLRQSDAICTALQLINFWQDLSRDIPRGRHYLPLTDCADHGVGADELLALRQTPATKRLIAHQCEVARTLMESGAPLVHTVPDRAGWELRLVVQGGLRILDKIESMNFATLTHRPTLKSWDFPAMLWRALRMRPSKP